MTVHDPRERCGVSVGVQPPEHWLPGHPRPCGVEAVGRDPRNPDHWDPVCARHLREAQAEVFLGFLTRLVFFTERMDVEGGEYQEVRT